MAWPKTRAKVGGWAFGEVFTSAQANAIDSNVVLGIDGSTGALDIQAHSVTRVMNGFISPILPANWTNVTQQGSTCSSSSQQFLNISLDIPHGATLTALSVWFTGAFGHSALPATKPAARLFKLALGVGAVPIQIGSTITDAPATFGAFELDHIIGASGGAGPTFTGLSTVIDRSANLYFLSVGTEGSTNSVAGDTVRTVVATFTVAKLDEG